MAATVPIRYYSCLLQKPEDMEELPEEVLSPAFSGACGITELAPGQEYLIAGQFKTGS